MRKTAHAPARLDPSDLHPVRQLVGDGALDYVLVISGFHFINRVVDLLGETSELAPPWLGGSERLRRLAVHAGSWIARSMDLANRPYTTSFEDAVARVAPLLHGTGADDAEHLLAPLRARPKLVEALQLTLEEREDSSLEPEVLAGIHRTVEDALPHHVDEASEVPASLADPVAHFAVVGTRCAYRATESMIDALRRAGYDDLGILDLAVAIGGANLWARVHRLLGLVPGLYYLGPSH